MNIEKAIDSLTEAGPPEGYIAVAVEDLVAVCDQLVGLQDGLRLTSRSASASDHEAWGEIEHNAQVVAGIAKRIMTIAKHRRS